MNDYIPVAERCLTCNGERQYATRKRDGSMVRHECEACHGTGRIPGEPAPADPHAAPPVDVPVPDDAPTA